MGGKRLDLSAIYQGGRETPKKDFLLNWRGDRKGKEDQESAPGKRRRGGKRFTTEA